MLLLLPQAVKYLYYKQKNELLPSELVMDIIITGVHSTFVTLPLITISEMSAILHTWILETVTT